MSEPDHSTRELAAVIESDLRASGARTPDEFRAALDESYRSLMPEPVLEMETEHDRATQMLTMKFALRYEPILSVTLCRENPDALIIFGDNLAGWGKGGQAVIRDEPNAVGIPTKKAPRMSENAFLSDADRTWECPYPGGCG